MDTRKEKKMLIDKDDRIWEVTLKFASDKCPHLFYPANLHACKLLDNVNAPNIRCRLEICPMKTEKGTKDANKR